MLYKSLYLRERERVRADYKLESKTPPKMDGVWKLDRFLSGVFDIRYLYLYELLCCKSGF